MKDIERKLLDMKEQIDEAKMKVAESKGALDELHKRMKTEFKVSNINEAQKLLADMQNRIQTIEADILKMTEDLERRYKWE